MWFALKCESHNLFIISYRTCKFLWRISYSSCFKPTQFISPYFLMQTLVFRIFFINKSMKEIILLPIILRLGRGHCNSAAEYFDCHQMISSTNCHLWKLIWVINLKWCCCIGLPDFQQPPFPSCLNSLLGM